MIAVEGSILGCFAYYGRKLANSLCCPLFFDQVATILVNSYFEIILSQSPGICVRQHSHCQVFPESSHLATPV